jgi:timeless protein
MLGVTAIREYVQALDRYCDASQEDSLIGMDELLVKWYMPIMHILRKLLVLRLRLYNPILQSRHYLCDIITANHVLLLTLERMSQNSADGVSFDIWKHLDQFCSKTILHRYGTALGDFKTNGIFINGCILTILHHVGLDLGRADLLCDPIILRPFSQMRECKFNVESRFINLSI